MAGPAIRYWEFAETLSEQHEVTLYTNQRSSLTSERFNLCFPEEVSLKAVVKNHDIIVSQLFSLRLAYYAKLYQKKIILDSYDPLPIEALECHKYSSSKQKDAMARSNLNSTQFSLILADRIICATPSQRDLWIGFLTGAGEITPALYDQDPSLNSRIGIVPFGMNATPPKREGKGLRELFNFKSTDFVVLWGGGDLELV